MVNEFIRWLPLTIFCNANATIFIKVRTASVGGFLIKRYVFWHFLWENVSVHQLKINVKEVVSWRKLQKWMNTRWTSEQNKHFFELKFFSKCENCICVPSSERVYYALFHHIAHIYTLYIMCSKYFDFTKNQVYTEIFFFLLVKSYKNRLFHENAVSKKETDPMCSLPYRTVEQRTQQHISTYILCIYPKPSLFNSTELHTRPRRRNVFTEKYTRNQSMRWVELISFVFDKCGVSYTKKSIKMDIKFPSHFN